MGGITGGWGYWNGEEKAAGVSRDRCPTMRGKGGRVSELLIFVLLF